MAIRIKFIQIELLNILNIHVLRAWRQGKDEEFGFNIELLNRNYLKLFVTDSKVPEGCAENKIIQDTVNDYIRNCNAENNLLYHKISRSNIADMYAEMCKDIEVNI